MSFVNPPAVQVSMADIKPAVSAARGSVSSNEGGGKIKTAKSRKRVNTAEKRASHNAVERQRREALNSRFLVRFLSRSDVLFGMEGKRADRLDFLVLLRTSLASSPRLPSLDDPPSLPSSTVLFRTL